MLSIITHSLYFIPCKKEAGIKLKELLNLNFIEPVTESTPCVSLQIAVPKNNNDIWLTGMCKANTTIKYNHYSNANF